MDQRFARINVVLKDVSTADWKTRIEALRELRSSLGDADVLSVRASVPNLVKQMNDGRSLVMQEACETARAICFAYGAEPEFPPIADTLVRACLQLVSSSTKVMSDAAKSCLKQVFHVTTRGFQGPFEKILSGAQAGPGKSIALRLECVKLIEFCLNEWDTEWMVRVGLLLNIESTSRKALRDADSEVRAAARSAYTSFVKKFPEEARKGLKEMEVEDRQRFQEMIPVKVQEKPASNLLMSSSVKRTPFRSVTNMPPPSTSNTVRKPLQMISFNTATPSSMRVRKFKDDNTCSKTTQTVAFPSLQSAAKQSAIQSERKRQATFRERLARDLVDLLGRTGSVEARTRMASAMKDIAEIFVSHAEDLELDDFIQCESAVELAVFSSDDVVVRSGMDALGTFVWALARCRDGTSRERESIMERLVSMTFPMALIKTQSTVDDLAQAALRAADTCAMFLSKNELLSYVLQYARQENDNNVMRYYSAVIDSGDESDESALTEQPIADDVVS